MLKPRHDWGDIVPTTPAMQKCNKCGFHRKVETGDIDLLPLRMKVLIVDNGCQKAEYTQFQIDNATESAANYGWHDGHDKGLHLQPEFTQQFFNKIRLNPKTLMYEIPQESYEILKQMMMTKPNAANQGRGK